MPLALCNVLLFLAFVVFAAVCAQQREAAAPPQESAQPREVEEPEPAAAEPERPRPEEERGKLQSEPERAIAAPERHSPKASAPSPPPMMRAAEQQAVTAGFVDGWAPATLEAGGSGFIGALWPVDDAGTATVSEGFYSQMADATVGGNVSEVLRRIRAAFAESGDPTVLAYVFYGDAQLRLHLGGGGRPR